MIRPLTEKYSQLIIYVLLSLMPIVGMAVDLVSPSLPAIATDLQVSAKIAKGVISVYLLGYALSNFVTGFLTDAWGRKALIRIGLSGFVLASLVPVFFPNIEMLLLARLLQGVTIGATAVIVRAMFADILPPEKMVRLAPMIGAMWGLGPVLGPVIGGYLQFYIGWKAGFCFFALISFVLLIAVFSVIPETHFNRQPLNIKTIKRNMIEILSHRLFIGMAILMGLAYSLIIVFNTLGPFLIQTRLHYSPIFFGHLALWLGLVFLATTFVCRILLKRFQVEQLLFSITHLFFFIAILAVIASYFFSKSIALIAVTSGLMYFVCGFVSPLSMGKGLSLFRHIAGTAGATMYLINISITSLAAFFISFVSPNNAILLMWIYGLLLLLCALVYWGLVRQRVTAHSLCGN